MPLLATLAALLATTAATAQDDPAVLDQLTIEAARMGKPATALPYTVTVIDREALENQLALGGDIAQLIGNVVPSFSPSRQKLSGFGESLRGREPLILIDGVPQSNPLRNGSRDGYTIDPQMIERIEIIHGANAIQGTGATGGIINFITRTPQTGGETGVTVQLSTNDSFESSGFGERLHVQHALVNDGFDGLFAATYNRTGLFFDADDRPIGVDTTQGDTMDGSSWDVFAKLGYSFGAQRLELTANHFEYRNDGDYVPMAGDRAAGIPTSAERGEIDGVPAENAVDTMALSYSHEALGRGALHWQVYRQDFSAIYGGGRFGVFQDPSLEPDLFDQSRNRSEKFGSKLTYNLPGWVRPGIDLTLGIDYLSDETFQDLVQTGRKWVPETEYVNWAPFVQADWTIDAVTLTGGVRREDAQLDVADFRTLAFYGSPLVRGGSPDFRETLTNFGANWRIGDRWTLFASSSEGFSMPDVGRVLRGINETGARVDDFLKLAPIVADNREVGFEFRHRSGELRASYFRSESDLGQRLVPDADGIFSVARERTEIEGIELRGMLDVNADTRLGANAALLDGRVDLDGDGRVDSDLGGVNIAPDRLNLYWEQRWGPAVNSRLQLNYLDGRTFSELDSVVAEFDGYETLDLVVDWRVNARHRLQLGLENLTDEQYTTYFSQVDSAPTASDFFAGRGRNLYLTWRADL